MTIIDVLSDLSLTRSEELLGCIHFGRMIAPHQAAQLMGVSKDYVLKLKKDLNKKGKMIISHHPARRGRSSIIYPNRYKAGPRMYELGPAGKTVVESIIGRKINYKPLSGAQKTHFYGINDILIRTLNHLIDKEKQLIHKELPENRKDVLARDRVFERVQWFNTQETYEIIQNAWLTILNPDRWKGKEHEREKLIDGLIFPDARLVIENKAYWIEFDNLTENIKPNSNRPKILEPPNQTYIQDKFINQTYIQDKFIKYINTMGPIKNHDIVIWVTASKKRKQNMEQCWKELQNSAIIRKKRQQVEQMGVNSFCPQCDFLCLVKNKIS